MKKAWLSVVVRTVLAGGSYAVGAWLKVFPNAPLWAYGVVGFLVCLLTFAEQFLTVIRPTRRLHEVAPLTMDDVVQELLTFLSGLKVNARMNIMIPGRLWLTPWRKRFKIHWHKGMLNQPDVNLSFPVELGVAGECFQKKTPILVNANGFNGSRLLPIHIQPNIDHLQFLAAYPIYEPARNGLQSGKLIGVLNLDSANKHAYSVIATARVFEVFNQRMQNIAVIAGRFYR